MYWGPWEKAIPCLGFHFPKALPFLWFNRHQETLPTPLTHNKHSLCAANCLHTRASKRPSCRNTSRSLHSGSFPWIPQLGCKALPPCLQRNESAGAGAPPSFSALPHPLFQTSCHAVSQYPCWGAPTLHPLVPATHKSIVTAGSSPQVMQLLSQGLSGSALCSDTSWTPGVVFLVGVAATATSEPTKRWQHSRVNCSSGQNTTSVFCLGSSTKP